MVVVGIGIRANTSLFEGQLLMEKGGIKVNGQMQTSDSSVYAVGDVAAFPIKLFDDNVGEVIHYGDFTSNSPRFGAYWVSKGQITGAFLEGGNRDDYEALSMVVRRKTKVLDMPELERQGLAFAIQESKKDVPDSGVTLGEKPTFVWYATAGVVAAVSISAFGYWYGRKRRRW
ncbi:unnamed protein product [Triticum turgidum subsp. durum]|uniref:monodehydroascorbate reductase (NADH) n=1 Tax=Triticum turgidum subsp. durum TaxID=4567 RepID=A0A9R0YSX7_TRITD|nr:unnamed protein product [Triticum turgidum subsp. durum]